MKTDYDTQHFTNICQNIMGCSNAKEANTIFENGIKPYLGKEQSKIIPMQTGSSSPSKSPPKTGYQKLLKGGVKNTKHVLITLTLVTFLLVYFAKNYDGNTFKSVTEFWKTHQDNLMRKIQTMLGFPGEKVQEMWTYFSQMKVFTMIGQVVKQSKGNIWTIVNYVRTKGAYILSLLVRSKKDIDMEKLREKALQNYRRYVISSSYEDIYTVMKNSYYNEKNLKTLADQINKDSTINKITLIIAVTFSYISVTIIGIKLLAK